MSDFQTVWNLNTNRADWLINTAGLATNDDLATAVIISLFTDSLADADDALPTTEPLGSLGRRGWWGDAQIGGAQPKSEDRLGSRLWLLAREKLTEATRLKAIAYAKESLAWMVTAKVASAIEVSAFIVPVDRLDMLITVRRPDGRIDEIAYSWAWQGVA